MLKKIVKSSLSVLIFSLAFAQLFRPQKNEEGLSAVDSFFKDTNPPEDVKLILKTACLDCHSNHTNYPWYNKITPLNYWIANHINNGKKHFNVSEWHTYSKKKRKHKLEECVEEIEEKHMPLSSYTLMHRNAKLTKEQIQAIKNWIAVARIKYAFTEYNDLNR